MLGTATTRVLIGRLIALAAFVGALWAIQVVNFVSGYGLNPSFGLIPRQVDGLDGIAGLALAGAHAPTLTVH